MLTSKTFHIIQKTRFVFIVKIGVRTLSLFLVAFVMPLLLQAENLKPKLTTDFPELNQLLKEQPFWRKKAVWESMNKNRKIPVSVTEKNEKWSFKGAGLVQAPADFCLKNAKDFKRLSALPDYFSDVSFDSKKSVLHMKVHILDRVRPLDLALFEENLGKESRIYFRSIGQWLTGMEGVLLLKDQERQQTEVGILAKYKGSIKWVPDFVFATASEAVMHHVAQSLRKTLEEDYKK